MATYFQGAPKRATHAGTIATRFHALTNRTRQKHCIFMTTSFLPSTFTRTQTPMTLFQNHSDHNAMGGRFRKVITRCEGSHKPWRSTQSPQHRHEYSGSRPTEHVTKIKRMAALLKGYWAVFKTPFTGILVS